MKTRKNISRYNLTANHWINNMNSISSMYTSNINNMYSINNIYLLTLCIVLTIYIALTLSIVLTAYIVSWKYEYILWT